MATRDDDDGRRLITLDSTPEWARWLGDLACTLGCSVSGTVDRACRELAASQGLPRPPDRLARSRRAKVPR